MKKIILLTTLTLLATSCITSTHMPPTTGTENLKREDYTVLEEQAVKSRTNKIWILFFPFGGKSEKTREAQCFDRMVTRNSADGVLAPKYVHKKFTIPLIVFTYTFKETELTGKPYVLNTDAKK